MSTHATTKRAMQKGMGEQRRGGGVPIPVLHEQGTSISVSAREGLPEADEHNPGANTVNKSRMQ